jgi:hypothetical protein
LQEVLFSIRITAYLAGITIELSITVHFALHNAQLGGGFEL